MKTNIINLIHNAQQRGETLNVPDLAASYRKAVVDCLTRNFFAAACDTGAKKLAIAGGVSANALLRRTMESECKSVGWSSTALSCATAATTALWSARRATMSL